jgi:hypothetical protein
MNKVQILLAACVAFSSAVLATSIEDPEASIDQEDTVDSTDQPDQAKESDPDLVKSVEEALKAIAKGSPQINEDSLRVWKNFTPSSKPVHYTYRFWGRQIVMWLKNEKKMAFQSKEQLGEVFKILWRKGLISKNAVVVLMVDAWSYLVYLEGSPSWEKSPEDRNSQKGMTPSVPSAPQKPNERSI